MNVKILKVEKLNDVIEVEGLVPAKCVVGYYNVRIKIRGFKIIESNCQCGQPICQHAVKLQLAYLRVSR